MVIFSSFVGNQSCRDHVVGEEMVNPKVFRWVLSLVPLFFCKELELALFLQFHPWLRHTCYKKTSKRSWNNHIHSSDTSSPQVCWEPLQIFQKVENLRFHLSSPHHH